MDQHTFDRFTRAIATGHNRRAFVRRLFGLGAAVAVGGTYAQSASAAPTLGTPTSTVPLMEPSEPTRPPVVVQTQSSQAEICLEPMVEYECGCLDPNTQTCCQDAVCTGDCTSKDGCCNTSSDLTDATRGEICGDHCCHPHLDLSNPAYSECCDATCCAGHCYAENLCCPVGSFCPGLDTDLCCGAGERCCGAGTDANACIPDGDASCCAATECALAPGACYVSCDTAVCRQHFCDQGATCCSDSCIAGNCCTDANCGVGEACLSGQCTAVECFADADCAGADACTLATCSAGACVYTAACEGECATCDNGVCSTDDALCGLCGTCDSGACIPIECPEGFSCYAETGECLGIA